MKKEKIINWIKKSKFLNRVYLSTVGLLNKNSDYNILEDDLKYTKKYFRRWMLLIYIMLLIPFVSMFVIPGYNAINSYLSSGEIPEIKIENGHLKADKILFKQFNKAFGIIINTNEKLNFKEAVTGNLNGKGFTFAELEEYKKASVLGNTPVVVLVTKDTIALKVSDSVSPVLNLEDEKKNGKLEGLDGTKIELNKEYLTQNYIFTAIAGITSIMIFVLIIYHVLFRTVAYVILVMLRMFKRIDLDDKQIKQVSIYGSTLPIVVIIINSMYQVLGLVTSNNAAKVSGFITLINIILYIIIIITIAFKDKYLSSIDNKNSNNETKDN